MSSQKHVHPMIRHLQKDNLCPRGNITHRRWSWNPLLFLQVWHRALLVAPGKFWHGGIVRSSYLRVIDRLEKTDSWRNRVKGHGISMKPDREARNGYCRSYLSWISKSFQRMSSWRKKFIAVGLEFLVRWGRYNMSRAVLRTAGWVAWLSRRWPWRLEGRKRTAFYCELRKILEEFQISTTFDLKLHWFYWVSKHQNESLSYKHGLEFKRNYARFNLFYFEGVYMY